VFVRCFKMSSTIYTFVVLAAICFGHIWAIIRQYLLSEETTEQYFVFCALRHIVVSVVNFLRRMFPSYLSDGYFSVSFNVVHFCCVIAKVSLTQLLIPRVAVV
jgi:hypothetical protein